MEGALRPAFDRQPVMLLASLPAEEEEGFEFEQVLEIQEAVLSFGRAAFSRGHPVAVPADAFVAPLLVAVAEEYRAPLRSEEAEEAPPQLMVGMVGRVEEELGGRPRRVAPAGVLQRRFDSFADFVVSVDPRKVIVVGGGLEELGDVRGDLFDRMRHRKVELQAIGPTLTNSAREQGWSSLDATHRLLAEIEWPRPGADRDDAPPRGAEGVVPYAYLMQRLLETDDDEGVAEAAGGIHVER